MLTESNKIKIPNKIMKYLNWKEKDTIIVETVKCGIYTVLQLRMED